MRRGTTAQHASFTGADGEVTFDTTKKALVLHDGVTPGGKPVEGWVKLTTGAPLVPQVVDSYLACHGGSAGTIGVYVQRDLSVDGNFWATVSTVTAGRFAYWPDVLTYTTPLVIVFGGAGAGSSSVVLAGNLALISNSLGAGAMRLLRIVCDATPRNLSFPAGWKFVGGAAPVSIAASKVALLEMWSYGVTDADVVARYSVEP